ncbi:MAG: lipase maturation factor family protein [Gammaproteobacteria bacterium]|nr:lipase maturation factor family protein [Gammaproteobacteria bacterium]
MQSATDFINRLSKIADNYQLTSWLFIKLLAVIYFIAFLSISVQIIGLVGSHGILPFAGFLDHLLNSHGKTAWLFVPNVFWLNSSDIALRLVPSLGCFFSVLLFFGVFKKWSLIILFVLYLSVFHAGQTFLSFQWDSLLLETGFLAIFLVSGPSHLLIFLFHWLLFRLRFMSGLSKLASGDPSWSNLTTLKYYFETQPLPHIGAWYFHQLPDWLLKFGSGFVLFTELIVPFFIFLPRKFRLLAAALTIFIQLLIIASSNHNWINLLTIVLCLFLLDDKIIQKIIPTKINIKPVPSAGTKHKIILPVVAVMIIVTSVSVFGEMATGKKLPNAVAQSTMVIRMWGIGHMFHVFPNMQTERHELQIQGSYDGVEWKNYTFKYKPAAMDEAPVFVLPHQPRLDWMIWFVPPQHWEMNVWFDRFLMRLRQGSPDVIGLLKKNPFPMMPPAFLRVRVFRYTFTSSEERAQTGNWWKREYLGLFPYVRPRRP